MALFKPSDQETLMSSLRMLAACAVIAAASPVFAQTAPDSLTERLISLRGQVDELQSELDVRREEHKNRMVYLTAQLADIEASRDREALRVEQIQQDVDEMREEVATAGISSEALMPFLRNQISALRAQVSQGFPFKVQERLAELDELETQLDNGLMTAQRGVNRLWAFIEDEFRISRENAIYSQSVALNGENVLVDVAKIGSVMMYFRTRDLEYGRAVNTPQGWRFELLDSAADQEMVARLFDSLRKQIRQGYFELPEALPPRGGRS
jgi:chromosome segregation ATPase